MPKLDENQISAVSRFFSNAVIQEMARYGKSPLLARLAREVQEFNAIVNSENVYQLFEEGFTYLKKKKFRHEYVYKAALTTNILLGIHNLNTASMLTEFRVGECRADIVILNGTATVYEIKSERDTLSRLEKQIESYMQVFAQVNVIAGENHTDTILKMVPKEIGVMELSKSYNISRKQKGESRPERTCPSAIFNSIQLKEAKIILKENNIKIPDVPNTQLYQELRSQFMKLKAVDAHMSMVETLKKTRSLSPLSSFMKDLPTSLKAVALSAPIRKRDYSRLLSALNTPVKDAMMWT